MRMQFKFAICLSLLCAIFSSNIGITSVKATQHSKTQSIHLKINKYFILYSQPHPPFIDNRYRLLIPLRSIQGLMGGTVTYDEITKKAVVKWLDRQFELVTGSAQAKVDGVPI